MSMVSKVFFACLGIERDYNEVDVAVIARKLVIYRDIAHCVFFDLLVSVFTKNSMMSVFFHCLAE